MKAQRFYAVPMLLVAITLVSISHAQTERPRTGPEAINSQDAKPAPSNSGAHAAPGTLPNSANNPDQAVPGDKQHLGQFGGRKWTPAADELSSPLAATVAVPESPATVPQYVLFESLFVNISLLNQVADHDDKAGKHTLAALWRAHDKRGAGLNDAEGQILQEIARDCLRALKEQDKRINLFADELHAQAPPGTAVQAPPELLQMVEDRKAIVNDHIERLKQALGDASFNKLDVYVRASFHGEVIVPKATSPSSTIIEKTQGRR